MKLFSGNYLLKTAAIVVIPLVSAAIAIYWILPAQAVAGMWQGDITGAIRLGWNDNNPQIFVKSAFTTITFHRFGLYESSDVAIYSIVTERGDEKPFVYNGSSIGLFAFHKGRGYVHELYGRRLVNGRPTKVQMPNHVWLELKDGSKITVVEDYGNYTQLQYTLMRKKIVH